MSARRARGHLESAWAIEGHSSTWGLRGHLGTRRSTPRALNHLEHSGTWELRAIRLLKTQKLRALRNLDTQGTRALEILGTRVTFIRGERSDPDGTSHLSEIHVILGVHQKDVPPE